MSVPTQPNKLRDEVHREYQRLDAGCRTLGVTATMFRTAKFLFYIATLLFTVYLIQYAGVEPTLAMMFAVLLISGPEGLETWLINRGQRSERDGKK